MRGAEPASVLTADQPWPGPEPYTEADRAFFHGRRREVEELRLLLQRDTLTLLTGAAGTGKTSLVRAGLLPSLEADCLPVFVTLDWAAASEQRPLSRQLLDAIEAAAKAHGLDRPPTTPGDTLWEVFHRTGARWWSARQRVITPLLVLDQFEAASHAASPRQRDRFIEELAELIANRPPARVGPRLEQGTEAADAFDFGPVPVRVLLVLREESLPWFGTLRAFFPTLHRSELRLADFTTSQARDILLRTTTQRELFAEGVIDQLVPRLATGSDPEHPVPPGVLSTQMHALAAERLRRKVGEITADFFAPPPAIAPPLPIETISERSPNRAPALLAALALLLAVIGAVQWQNQHVRSTTENSTVSPSPAEPARVASAPPPPISAVATPTLPPVVAEATPVPASPTPAPPAFMPGPAPTTSIIPPAPTPIPPVEDRDAAAARAILERERQRDLERLQRPPATPLRKGG